VARHERGLCSRPTLDEVYRYREAIELRVEEALGSIDDAQAERIEPAMTLGLHHEQQHQELLLTDLKLILWRNPLRPAYLARFEDAASAPAGWATDGPEAIRVAASTLRCGGGMAELGAGPEGFAFDNERPRHRVWLDEYQLHSRLVTAGEYIEFIEAGGYDRPELWLADGWAAAQAQGWRAPLYWEKQGARWWRFTLRGMLPVDERAPVSHVSYYEADAFARHQGRRLPTEAEWECAAARTRVEGNLLDSGCFEPVAASDGNEHQFWGDVWEWTMSPYVAYPGFRPLEGRAAEYNGKFMCNQWVLRGGSCVTPESHVRPTYRNFFYPDARWQFTGMRLAL
jgi:ergothioneine biosynthesis protein EgtB